MDFKITHASFELSGKLTTDRLYMKIVRQEAYFLKMEFNISPVLRVKSQLYPDIFVGRSERLVFFLHGTVPLDSPTNFDAERNSYFCDLDADSFVFVHNVLKPYFIGRKVQLVFSSKRECLW